jgi:outer membrane protein OmpA-like peptidoglycan-associated protein
MSGRAILVSLVALALPGAGCVATQPYVRTEVQKSDARTQQQLDTVDRRLDAIEQELAEEKTRLRTLDADTQQIRVVVEETAKQADQAMGLAVKAATKAEEATRDTSQTISPVHPSKTLQPSETLVVRFGFAQWQLDNQTRLALLQVVKRLRENPTLVVKLEGHADNAGSRTQNLVLSERRAQEVRRFLVASGVKRTRIEVLAIGESQPIASNRSPTGRDQNRRVAITVLAPGR